MAFRNLQIHYWIVRFCCFTGVLILFSKAGAAAEDTLSYNAHVRPILAEHCFACHGQDASARKAGLRLDTATGATAPLKSGSAAITRQNPCDSLLIQRITSHDPDEIMPPPATGKVLTSDEKETLHRWIAEGAVYEAHWAYVAPKRPAIPKANNADWIQNPIDAFVLAQLEEAGKSPSPPANRYTLMRRLSLDLIGLPPTPDKTDTFVQDERPDALEWVLDELLASPRFGEHWARRWLDLARYADSNGYHIDTKRSMWPYRDWVIQALNQNMPFDQFTVEQIAGDLLPNATVDQRIATGFHRNTLFNEEGGIDPEEFRTKAVVDRVNTTMTVWMGTTMGCAECHEHKYDPFSQAEFYQLYAFFNTVPELGGGTFQSMAPLVKLPPSPSLQAKLDGLQSQIRALEAVEPEDTEEASPRLVALRKQLEETEKEIPSSLVMAEMEEARETRIHTRGDFLQPGEVVFANVPAVWPPLETVEGQSLNRLDLAQWLVDRKNPLTARVTVNRIWQNLFGYGLVETLEDFGSRGAMPSHPALLDWLAVEFMESGWDMKALLRLMVSSATYQQHSAAGTEAYQENPKNVLLGRGPRMRLEAEIIRDTALTISGLMHHEVGGPSVFPYQPAGLWTEKALTGYEVGSWPMDSGPQIYRRGLYTFRRRSVPYPMFQTFDGPSFEVCTAQRSRTNTPLQALVTLNDPQFVEAARVFAQRILDEGGPKLKEKLRFALRESLLRPAEDAEIKLLGKLFTQRRLYYAAHETEARKLVEQGRSVVPAHFNTVDLAAWTVVANALLNLDEVLNKG